MKRSRIREQRYQQDEERGRSSSPRLLIPSSSISSQDEAQAPLPSLLQPPPPPRRKASNGSIGSIDSESLPSHRNLFKLICILGMLLWTLGYQSNRFIMEGAAAASLRGSELPQLTDATDKLSGSIAIAHLGNSIQYYNDCPRMLENMMLQTFAEVTQDSCLRGGANVTSLWEKGSGMQFKFATPSALRYDGTYDIGSPTVESLLTSNKWDFVIINDHTQNPVRATNKTESIQTLKEKYVPLLEQHNATVILLMTAAYKSPVKDSGDLGDFDDFTQALLEGYAEYATLFDNVKIAPLGLAYQYVREHNDTAIVPWETLYAPDDFHPSPHGTYLEACLLYCTITDQVPPDYQVYWWSRARYMQPHNVRPPMALPTKEEADYLRSVAVQVCNIIDPQSGDVKNTEQSRLSKRMKASDSKL